MMSRTALLMASVLIFASSPGPAQIPTFSTKTEEVIIDVLVSDEGKPVLGLRPSDFEVYDNGVAQRIKFAALERIPVNAILALDTSQSVAGQLLARLKRAGSSFLDALKPDERAALVTFGHQVELRSPLTSDFRQVRAALQQTRPYGDTSVIDATYAGLVLAESGPGRALLVVFSDGIDTSSWLTSEAVLDAARSSQTVVYAVTAGGPRKTFLNDIAEITGGSAFRVDPDSKLEAVFLAILEEFRQRYLVTYSPLSASRAGWHRLKVVVKGQDYKVKARQGYLR